MATNFKKNIKNLIEKRKNMKQCPERHSQFGRLPVELKMKIFSKLNLSDRKKLRLVCPHWRSIVDDKLKFNGILTNSTLSWLQNCNYILKTLSMQNLTESLNRWNTQLPYVHEFIVGRGNSCQNIQKLLNYLNEKTNGLVFQNLSLSCTTPYGIARAFPKTKWFCLATLCLTLGTRNAQLKKVQQYGQHIEAIVAILKTVHLPTLKNLTINLEYADETSSLKQSSNEFKKPVLEVLSFIIRHTKSLKELGLTLRGRPVSDQRITKSEKLYELPKLQLEKFSIKFDTLNTALATTLCLSINKVTHLKTHEICWMDGNEGFHNGTRFHLENILRKHGPTLEVLEAKNGLFPFGRFEELITLKSLIIRTSVPVELLGGNFDILSRPPPMIIPKLTKFSAIILNDEVEDLDDRLITCIRNQLPNIEDVEIILMGNVYSFTKTHLEILLRMPKLTKLKLGHRFTPNFIQFCEALNPESGITFTSGEERLQLEILLIFNYAALNIKRDLLPISLVGRVGGRQTR